MSLLPLFSPLPKQFFSFPSIFLLYPPWNSVVFCFLAPSLGHISFLPSLSVLLSPFSPVLLWVFYPSHPHSPHLTLPRTCFGAQPVLDFNSRSLVGRRCCHTNGQTLLCHHLMLQPHLLLDTHCSSAISCLSCSAKLQTVEMAPAVNSCPDPCVPRVEALTVGTLP